MTEPDFFRLCTTCKKPIAFGSSYLQCSVSTCNRAKLAQFFCSLPCWDAHLPEAKHRDAWAEPMKAPTREREMQDREKEDAPREIKSPTRKANVTEEDKRRRVVDTPSEAEPKEVLVVVSKLKAYVKARAGMNTSDAVAEVLSDRVRKLCDDAIAAAQADGRKTVLDRDFK